MAAAEEKKAEEKKVEEKPKVEFKFPPNETQLGIIAGIIAALITIFTGLPAVIKAVGMIFAFVWCADSVRKTSKYGLGTGVPSIGVMGTGYGVVGALMGLAFARFGNIGQFYPGVLVGVVFMGLIGLVSGFFSNSEKYIALKIPRLERAMMELGMAGTLALLLEISIVTGSLNFDAVVTRVMETGVIAFMFILSGMAMFHPYNACLGPDERRERTLMVPVEISGLLCIILGFALLILGTSPWGPWDPALLIVFGVVIWVVFYTRFIKTCMKECYATVGTGLIKTIE
ncbi:MAG: tetrahydromethanopterin S-methyltransferase subunit C [Methanophagales archaeon ANME-1-THS]|nr:MAG: tetrahydromethanopterin S-methyltransferase subunit C [Methanophagales archaeon ANME-1-THS]